GVTPIPFLLKRRNLVLIVGRPEGKSQKGAAQSRDGEQRKQAERFVLQHGSSLVRLNDQSTIGSGCQSNAAQRRRFCFFAFRYALRLARRFSRCLSVRCGVEGIVAVAPAGWGDKNDGDVWSAATAY